MTTSGFTHREIEEIVVAAVAAPSILNTQPWRFRAHGDLIELRADPGRDPHVIDIDGRELLLSCGAALFNLRLAVTARGRAPVVRLLPDPADPLLLARVRIAGSLRPGNEELLLAKAIPGRRTSREPFSDDPVPPNVLIELMAAAAIEGARLDVASDWHRSQLAAMVHNADFIQRNDPRVVSEIASWTLDRRDSGSGIPAELLGPRADDPKTLVRDFDLGRRAADRGSAHFEKEPVLAVLMTEHDRPTDRLRAGQALERVLLTATSKGLSTSMLMQPIEVAEMRQLLRDPHSGIGSPQVLIKFGYGRRPPQTPRRPVLEVLEFV